MRLLVQGLVARGLPSLVLIFRQSRLRDAVRAVFTECAGAPWAVGRWEPVDALQEAETP